MLAKLIAVGAACLLALTGALAGLAAATEGSGGCLDASIGPVAGLDHEQAGYAQVIVAVGQQRGVPARGLVVALMTAMQESGLRNLDYGDRDSLGLFQQRPSMGWGTPDEVRDPAHAAAAFFGGPGSPVGNRGLLDVAGWEAMPLAKTAQAVQRSAFPVAYAKWETAAWTWLANVATDPPGSVASACGPTSASARVAIAAAERWLGTPYSWAGGDLSGPTYGTGTGAGTVGFDCSGLTRYAWAQAGILLPRTSRDQWNAPGLRITTMAQLQPGDLVFFASNPNDPTTVFHVALALGGDAIIEAPQTGDVVKVVQALSGNSYWAPEFIGGLRLTG